MRAFNCGGNWNNGANAGVFDVNGNNARSNANGNIGFRSLYPNVRCFRLTGLIPAHG